VPSGEFCIAHLLLLTTDAIWEMPVLATRARKKALIGAPFEELTIST